MIDLELYDRYEAAKDVLRTRLRVLRRSMEPRPRLDPVAVRTRAHRSIKAPFDIFFSLSPHPHVAATREPGNGLTIVKI